MACFLTRVVSTTLGALAVASAALGSAIPPAELFFAPSSLSEGPLPSMPASGDGEVVPWMVIFTPETIASFYPEALGTTIVGAEVLPPLNPNVGSPDGSYDDASLAAIGPGNWPAYYARLPGFTLGDPFVDYVVDLDRGVLGFSTLTGGAYVIRVKAVAPNARGGAPLEFLFIQRLGHEEAIPLGEPTSPVTVEREFDPESFGSFTDEGGVAVSPFAYFVSTWNEGDPYLPLAFKNLTDLGKNPKKVKSLAELKTEAAAAKTAAGRKVRVVLIAHGVAANPTVAKLFIGNFGGADSDVIREEGGTKTPTQMGEALKDSIVSVVLASCRLGLFDPFCQKISDAAQANVESFEAPVNATRGTGPTPPARGFSTSGKGKVKKYSPCAPPGGFLLGGPEDLDYDGVVDGNDVGIVLAGWGGPGCADLNGDGNIDGRDLGIVLAAWSAPVP